MHWDKSKARPDSADRLLHQLHIIANHFSNSNFVVSKYMRSQSQYAVYSLKLEKACKQVRLRYTHRFYIEDVLKKSKFDCSFPPMSTFT